MWFQTRSASESRRRGIPVANIAFWGTDWTGKEYVAVRGTLYGGCRYFDRGIIASIAQAYQQPPTQSQLAEARLLPQTPLLGLPGRSPFPGVDGSVEIDSLATDKIFVERALTTAVLSTSSCYIPSQWCQSCRLRV